MKIKFGTAFLLLIVLILVGVGVFNLWNVNRDNPPTTITSKSKVADAAPVLTIALVTDSHNSNDNLQSALTIAKDKKADFVIHLGDLSNVGTMSELTSAKTILDQLGLKYYVLPGDHEYYVSEWDGKPSIENFTKLFGNPPTSVLLSYDKDESSNVKAQISNKYKNSNVKIEGEFLFLHEPLYPLGKDEDLLEKVRKSNIKAVIAGDAHFSSQTVDSVRDSLTHIVVGALAKERNLQSPRFSILQIYEGGSYNVEEIIL